jgi:hypothetical protein
MPYLSFILKRKTKTERYRERKYISISSEETQVTLMPMSASTVVNISGTSPIYGLMTSTNSLTSPKGDTGRESKITITSTGYLDISIEPEDFGDRLKSIRQITFVMQDPYPLDENGKPT